MEGLQFTNITVETFFYERAWLGGAEPIHITALPRTVNTEVGARCTKSMHALSGERCPAEQSSSVSHTPQLTDTCMSK